MRSGRADRTRAASHAERRASRDGYFAPESVIRRLGDTPVTPFLGGGAAVLLQIAHPLVAAGVLALLPELPPQPPATRAKARTSSSGMWGAALGNALLTNSAVPHTGITDGRSLLGNTEHE